MRTNFLLTMCLAFTACSSDDSTAPTISNLTMTPTTLPVAQQTTVSGTFSFVDPDGDLDQIGIEVTLPDGSKQGSKQGLPMTDLMNVGTMTEGQLAWALIVAPPQAGTYQLSLWITDLDMNESNHLQSTATAQ
jgi:hypothetical protein